MTWSRGRRPLARCRLERSLRTTTATWRISTQIYFKKTSASPFCSPTQPIQSMVSPINSSPPLVGILERHCPLRKRAKFAAARRDSRWLNDEAITAKRERRRLERKWKATKNESDRVSYRKFCREVNKKVVGAREEFYKERIQAAASDPRRRWSKIRNVLHMTSPPEVLPPEEYQGRCDRFIEFFVCKIRSVKQAVSEKVDSLDGDRMDPLFQDHAHVGLNFAELDLPSIDDVKKLLGSIPGKSSNMNGIPTSLLKSCADIFAPLIARLAALLFRDGKFLSRFKIASVTPLLKKPGLDSEVPGNYRPISNLNNISKILERLFLRNKIDHVSSSPRFNSSKSAYRKDHSTETVLFNSAPEWYLLRRRQEISKSPDPPWSISGLRHTGHQHTHSPSRAHFRYSGACTQLDQVLPHEQVSVCTGGCESVCRGVLRIRRSAGIGPWTSPFHSLHRTSCKRHHITWSQLSSVYRWHSIVHRTGQRRIIWKTAKVCWRCLFLVRSERIVA